MEIIFNKEQLDDTAANFLTLIGNARVMAFHGDMGAGKTTFIHALCRQLGVLEDMGSPTFSIINEYLDAQGQAVYHMDLYRLKNKEEVVQAGVSDCLDSGSYCLVEWPEKAPELFEADTLHCFLKTIDSHTRSIKILS